MGIVVGLPAARALGKHLKLQDSLDSAPLPLPVPRPLPGKMRFQCYAGHK